MIPALQQLNDAIEELEEYAEVCGLIDAEQPSALVLMVDPLSRPNCSARIVGDCNVLVQALLVASKGNEAFRTALVDALPQFFRLAS